MLVLFNAYGDGCPGKHSLVGQFWTTVIGNKTNNVITQTRFERTHVRQNIQTSDFKHKSRHSKPHDYQSDLFVSWNDLRKEHFWKKD